MQSNCRPHDSESFARCSSYAPANSSFRCSGTLIDLAALHRAALSTIGAILRLDVQCDGLQQRVATILCGSAFLCTSLVEIPAAGAPIV